MADDRETPPELEAWREALVREFGIADEQVPLGALLALASDAAHGVTRPAAPLSAFVAGLVAGTRGGTPEEIADAIAAIRSLIAKRHAEGVGG